MTAIGNRNSDIAGSWFPTGYYGHFRNIPRNDFSGEYRQLAKPQPPKVFITRLKEKPTKHIFSKHDNRFSNLSDATYLDMGIGKKRRIVNAQTFHSNSELLSWSMQPPDYSVYRSTFTNQCPSNLIIPNLNIVKSSSPSPEDQRTTTYRYAFGNSNVNKSVINKNYEELLHARPAPVIDSIKLHRRCKSSYDLSGRESVADCLIWHQIDRYSAKEDKRSVKILECTQLQCPLTQLNSAIQE